MPQTVACQVPLSMGFPRQEYWSGLPIPSPGDDSNLGIESGSPLLEADSFILNSVYTHFGKYEIVFLNATYQEERHLIHFINGNVNFSHLILELFSGFFQCSEVIFPLCFQ